MNIRMTAVITLISVPIYYTYFVNLRDLNSGNIPQFIPTLRSLYILLYPSSLESLIDLFAFLCFMLYSLFNTYQSHLHATTVYTGVIYPDVV